MAMIVRAAEGVPGIPPGFPILLDDHMTIMEPAFAYLIETQRFSAARAQTRPCAPTLSTYTTGSTRWNNQVSTGEPLTR